MIVMVILSTITQCRMMEKARWIHRAFPLSETIGRRSCLGRTSGADRLASRITIHALGQVDGWRERFFLLFLVMFIVTVSLLDLAS